MSRIIGVALLFVILVDNFCHSTASRESSVQRCICRSLPKGKLRCRSSLLPANNVGKQILRNCVCSRTNQHKLKVTCATSRPGIPITLA